MGLYDKVKCEYPLPVPGANDLLYQSKTTPNQSLDSYVIRKDGTLWVEEYDIEDRSEATAWVKANPGKTYQDLPEALQDILALAGCATRINPRWVQLANFTGEITFHTFWKEDVSKRLHEGWIDWSAYFVKGQLKELHLLEHSEK